MRHTAVDPPRHGEPRSRDRHGMCADALARATPSRPRRSRRRCAFRPSAGRGRRARGDHGARGSSGGPSVARVAVIVVGAGISGVACARELSARGVPVRVLERARTVVVPVVCLGERRGQRVGRQQQRRDECQLHARVSCKGRHGWAPRVATRARGRVVRRILETARASGSRLERAATSQVETLQDVRRRVRRGVARVAAAARFAQTRGFGSGPI